MLSDDFLAMKEIAEMCGSSQQRVGRALAKLGLWIVGDGPTRNASDGGYVTFRTYPHRPDIGDRSLPVWHKEKTLAALKTVGIIPLPTFAAYLPAPQPLDQDEENDDADENEEGDYDEDDYEELRAECERNRQYDSIDE